MINRYQHISQFQRQDEHRTDSDGGERSDREATGGVDGSAEEMELLQTRLTVEQSPET